MITLSLDAKKPWKSSYMTLFLIFNILPQWHTKFQSFVGHNKQRNYHAAFIWILSCNKIVSDCASVKQTGNCAVIIAKSADLSSDTCKNAAAFLSATERKMKRTRAEGFSLINISTPWQAVFVCRQQQVGLDCKFNQLYSLLKGNICIILYSHMHSRKLQIFP